MHRYLCIHGHFYQPPRENPWLERVELQDSAYPYHDWNERITAECYAPNAATRILDDNARIVDIVNNYSRISFNFGPTLLAWMKDCATDVYAAILDADRQSQERFSGHGSAMAQVYNHVIMPLANARDKRTQVIWAIRDFEHRFGRKTEGMWLPECAADTESLEVLAELGIKFTVLSPFQASKFRKLGDEDWTDANGGLIDPSRAYQMNLPSGRSIALFFYDSPVSKAVAFERLLHDGGTFAKRLASGFSKDRDWDQLMHIATDGESYGHHHRFGEMALAAALNYIEANELATLTNYGEFLERFPPTHEAQIHERSAWSCAHGVGRWHTDCGCNSGGRPNWHQRWRQPLRDALDWLREELDPAYELRTKEFLKDPWGARDEYIAVVLNRSDENIRRFFQEQAARELTAAEEIICLRLLEIQRHAMLMYTSCGWFFDELSGIETVQVIQYAGRAVQLAQLVLKCELEPGFLDKLSNAPSNISEFQNGRWIYENFVRPSFVDREHLGAHFVVSSLFQDYPGKAQISSFGFEQRRRETFELEKARLILGSAKVTFEITRGSDEFAYAAMHSNGFKVTCGIGDDLGEEAFRKHLTEISEPFLRGDFHATEERLKQYFGQAQYSLKSLFKDEQQRIVNQILAATHEDLESRYRQIADEYTPLMRFLKEIGAPLPPALKTAAVFIINTELRRGFEKDDPNPRRLQALLEEARSDNIELHRESLSYAIKTYLDHRLERITQTPEDLLLLSKTAEVAEIVRRMNFDLNLWKAQNLYFKLLHSVASSQREQAAEGENTAKDWLKDFLKLGDHLGFKVE